jgi:hypothetical protein
MEGKPSRKVAFGTLRKMDVGRGRIPATFIFFGYPADMVRVAAYGKS